MIVPEALAHLRERLVPKDFQFQGTKEDVETMKSIEAILVLEKTIDGYREAVGARR